MSAAETTRAPQSILFMCTMNAIRSPLAEAIAAARLPKGVLVRSAGVRSGERNPFADAIIAERGLPALAHEPQEFDAMADGLFDVIVALSEPAHAEAKELSRTSHVAVEFWPMPDPSTAEGRREQVLEAYRSLADELEARIVERFG